MVTFYVLFFSRVHEAVSRHVDLPRFPPKTYSCIDLDPMDEVVIERRRVAFDKLLDFFTRRCLHLPIVREFLGLDAKPKSNPARGQIKTERASIRVKSEGIPSPEGYAAWVASPWDGGEEEESARVKAEGSPAGIVQERVSRGKQAEDSKMSGVHGGVDSKIAFRCCASEPFLRRGGRGVDGPARDGMPSLRNRISYYDATRRAERSADPSTPVVTLNQIPSQISTRCLKYTNLAAYTLYRYPNPNPEY